jgi:hypothetical protein
LCSDNKVLYDWLKNIRHRVDSDVDGRITRPYYRGKHTGSIELNLKAQGTK